MKVKYCILLLLMIFLCGCSATKDDTIEGITSRLATKIDKANTYHTGFKYYVPSSMSVTEYFLYNDVIEDDKYTYYLYVDVISYNNKSENTYKINPDAYYSATIESDDISGYIEINLTENSKYLIEIMYNYAKIEVMVDSENDINDALTYATSILRSIQYNDIVIANLLGEDVLTFQEEEYNVFNKVTGESNYLKYEAEQIEDEDDTGNVPDPDLLN